MFYRSRFLYPLTTQPGLKLREQQLIDAVNWDSLVQYVREGNELDREQKGIVRELSVKLGRNFKREIS